MSHARSRRRPVSKKAVEKANKYSVIIQWSEEDEAFVATLPEWGGCHTHGATYEEAAKNAREVLELLIETEQEEGRELPPAHGFMFPGPTGFTYELNHLTPVRKVRHVTA
ncbi:MAG TPA: type II toxin-antitoxin system HicB family antitoxin [Phycisphaerae bacterium]|nr:type II toxin-antitoxin system HicB family antitoxin [Phycisphaerae bacterium]